MKNSWLNIKGSMCLKCPICQYLHILHLIHQIIIDHTVPHTLSHTNSFLSYVTLSHVQFLVCTLGYPVKPIIVQVLTCHRLGCDLDVTRLPGIVLSQRGSLQQDALKILLSDTLAKSGLLRRRIGCLLLLTILSVYLHGFSSLYL